MAFISSGRLRLALVNVHKAHEPPSKPNPSQPGPTGTYGHSPGHLPTSETSPFQHNRKRAACWLHVEFAGCAFEREDTFSLDWRLQAERVVTGGHSCGCCAKGRRHTNLTTRTCGSEQLISHQAFHQWKLR